MSSSKLNLKTEAVLWFYLRVKDSSSVKEPKVKDETSSDSEDKIMVKSLSMAKRKGEMEGGEVVEKRKKGRPRKDAKIMPVSQPFPQVAFSLSRAVCKTRVLKSTDWPV